MTPGAPAVILEDLGQEFFQAMNSADPFGATMLGVPGFDGQVMDPSRVAASRNARRFLAIEEGLAQIDPARLSSQDRVNHQVLTTLAWGARTDLEHGLWEANASAAAYVAPQGILFQAVPATPLPDPAAVDGYLERLSKLAGCLDAIRERFLEADRDGRVSTRAGVEQAIAQLDGHLAQPLAQDVLLMPTPPSGVDSERFRSQAGDLVQTSVRPAMRRLLEHLRGEMLPRARDDQRVGIRFVPGGEAGYRDAVRRHTTTDLNPEAIHQMGLDRMESLEGEWADLGQRVLGTGDPADVRARLRQDRGLRFQRREEILETVGAALKRAEAARDRYFPPYRLAPCVIEEISPVEAGNAALAYYRPPAADGSRPGAHCVLTTDPEERFRFEYEALAFHESTPGHHLQLASAQQLADVPRYRRYLDAEVCGYVEGWGLYAERLADEMGLYTSDLQRLGMLSFESWRAARLVVDTGMHHLGWSRQQAVDYMWQHTATTRSNIENEVVRYIAWPGQALAYMVGCQEIRRLRAVAQERLGAKFDLRGFHGAVLSQGAVPLQVVGSLVATWIDGAL
ncbi:MAG: DUF885 domain-containing protein [Candidatus Dormibacteria bacterium]